MASLLSTLGFTCACLLACLLCGRVGRLSGTTILALSIRRREYFVPVGILLKAFLEVRDHEILERMLRGSFQGNAGLSWRLLYPIGC